MVRLHDNSSGREGHKAIASGHEAHRSLFTQIYCKVEHHVVFSEWYLIEGAYLLIVIEILDKNS